MENLPAGDSEPIEISFQGEVLQGRRDNLKLFTFLGSLAAYDGILYRYEEGEDKDGATVAYMTADYLTTTENIDFEALKKRMIESHYPCFLNMPELPAFMGVEGGSDIGALPEPSTSLERAPETHTSLRTDDECRSPNYIEFDRIRSKPLPSTSEASIQLFEYLMQRVDDPDDPLTFEQATTLLEFLHYK